MSDNQVRQPAGELPAEQPARASARADIAALTAAVERLLRRDLEVARERLRGNRPGRARR